MVSFNFGLFLLAAPVLADSKLRGNPPESVVQRDLASHGYHERLGQCQGATCGLWGDPHIITCDGLGYDCQGLGTFNLMENHMYKIQGRFVDIGAHEHNLVRGWGLTQGASLTNDIAIQFKRQLPLGPNGELEDPPVIQFGFGDLSRHDGTFPSEDGCTEYQYYNPNDMTGQRRSVEPSVEACRERCEGVTDCTKFSWWADGGCHVNDDHQTPRASPRNWPRSLSGPKEECGHPPEPAELEDDEERFKAGVIGPRCPLLMHLDGNLIDISQVGNWGFYLGGHDGPIKVQNINNHAILIQYFLGNGEFAEIHLVVRGHGPGELWSCHFDFWVCLPEIEQGEFMKAGASTGLMGTPNGNTQDDYMDKFGETIHIVNHANDWQKTMIDYCYDNHCTLHDDSIMTPPAGMTFEDIKCENVDYQPWDPEDFSCVLTPEQIYEQCSHKPPLMIHGCELDCCRGGCNYVEDVVAEVTEFKTLSTEKQDIVHDDPKPPVGACPEGEFENTSDTVCPSSDLDIVKVLSTSGTQPLPPHKDVFYDIKMDSGDDNKGRTLKFKVNNPFDEKADAYVKYGKSVFGHSFLDPKCGPLKGLDSGCDNDATEFEVGCRDYDSIEPFALVQVYFVSSAVEGNTEIDECCYADDEDDRGVVMYTFEIQCACPENAVKP